MGGCVGRNHGARGQSRAREFLSESRKQWLLVATSYLSKAKAVDILGRNDSSLKRSVREPLEFLNIEKKRGKLGVNHTQRTVLNQAISMQLVSLLLLNSQPSERTP